MAFSIRQVENESPKSYCSRVETVEQRGTLMKIFKEKAPVEQIGCFEHRHMVSLRRHPGQPVIVSTTGDISMSSVNGDRDGGWYNARRRQRGLGRRRRRCSIGREIVPFEDLNPGSVKVRICKQGPETLTIVRIQRLSVGHSRLQTRVELQRQTRRTQCL